MSATQSPSFDHSAETDFLKRSIARAITPRTKARVEALKRLEPLVARTIRGAPLGVQGYLLSSLTRQYPISYRAIFLELSGHGPQRLVEVAEQVELRLWVANPSPIAPRGSNA